MWLRICWKLKMVLVSPKSTLWPPLCQPAISFLTKKQKLKSPQNLTQFIAQSTSNSLQQFPCQPLPRSSYCSSSLIPAVLEDPGNWSKLNILKIPVIDQYSDRPPQLCGSITILWTDSPMTWRQRHLWGIQKYWYCGVCSFSSVWFLFYSFLPLFDITYMQLWLTCFQE